MGNSKNKFYRLEGSQISFSPSELRYICQFFDCQSPEDLAKAVERYECLFLTREGIYPDEVNSTLALALSLASDLYENFHCLGKPLGPKPKEKRNGPAPKIKEIPTHILEILQTEKENGHWEKKPTQLALIKRLQGAGVLPNDVAASSLEKDIQDFKRRKKQLMEAFKDIKPLSTSKKSSS